MITVVLTALITTVCLADKPVPPECKDKYQCFVPGDCTSWMRKESIALLDFEVNKMHNQCGALLKIHKLNDHWVLIEMESLSKSVSSIDFEYDNESILSCAMSNGTVTVTTPYRKDEGLTRITDAEETLKCTVGLKNRLKKMLPSGEDMKLSITKKEIKTEYSVRKQPLDYRCDPSHLRFAMDENEEDRGYLYSPVKYSPMSAYCERGGFFRTMEYRQEIDDEFAEISSLTCVGDQSSGFKFAIDGVAVEDGKDLVVRCVADSSFFCDYDPKSRHGETALMRTRANESTSSPSKLECPPGYQYLIVNNKSPKKGITITCQIYGGRMAYWTTSDGQILARNGPEVYCSNKLPCERIQTKNVKMGQVVEAGLKPKCFENGTLTISDETGEYDEEEDYEFKCDAETGKLKFEGDGARITVTNLTIFTCTYPKPEALLTTSEIGIGIIVIIAISTVIMFFALVFIVFRTVNYYKNKQVEKKETAVKYDNLQLALYRYNEVEEDEVEEEDKKEPESGEKKEDPNLKTARELNVKPAMPPEKLTKAQIASRNLMKWHEQGVLPMGLEEASWKLNEMDFLGIGEENPNDFENNYPDFVNDLKLLEFPAGLSTFFNNRESWLKKKENEVMTADIKRKEKKRKKNA